MRTRDSLREVHPTLHHLVLVSAPVQAPAAGTSGRLSLEPASAGLPAPVVQTGQPASSAPVQPDALAARQQLQPTPKAEELLDHLSQYATGRKARTAHWSDVYEIIDAEQILCLPTNTILRVQPDRGNAVYHPSTHLRDVRAHYNMHIADFDFYFELQQECKKTLGLDKMWRKRLPFQVHSAASGNDPGRFLRLTPLLCMCVILMHW